MGALSTKQIKYLRGQAHNLPPLVLVGKNGVTENLVREVASALDAHELVKIKFVEHKEEREAMSEEIAAKLECTLVGILGNTAVFYLEHPKKDKRRIDLPQD